MTCETAETFLHRSLEEYLTQAERLALDAHWEGCAACRRERDAQRRLAHLAHRWSAQTLASSDPGGAFTRDVLARLEMSPKRTLLSSALPPAVLAVLFAALVFLPGQTLFPIVTLASSFGKLPHWLALNLSALPSDAQALRLLPAPTLEPLWGRVLLPLAVGLNVLFWLSARQNGLRRSVS